MHNATLPRLKLRLVAIIVGGLSLVAALGASCAGAVSVKLPGYEQPVETSTLSAVRLVAEIEKLRAADQAHSSSISLTEEDRAALVKQLEAALESYDFRREITDSRPAKIRTLEGIGFPGLRDRAWSLALDDSSPNVEPSIVVAVRSTPEKANNRRLQEIVNGADEADFKSRPEESDDRLIRLYPDGSHETLAGNLPGEVGAVHTGSTPARSLEELLGSRGPRLDGLGSEVALSRPGTPAVDRFGTIFFADDFGLRIYRPQDKTIRTLSHNYRFQDAKDPRRKLSIVARAVTLSPTGRLFVGGVVNGTYRVLELKASEAELWTATLVAGGGTQMPRKEPIDAEMIGLGSDDSLAMVALSDHELLLQAVGGLVRIAQVGDGPFKVNLLTPKVPDYPNFGSVEIHALARDVDGSVVVSAKAYEDFGGTNLDDDHSTVCATNALENPAGVDTQKALQEFNETYHIRSMEAAASALNEVEEAIARHRAEAANNLGDSAPETDSVNGSDSEDAGNRNEEPSSSGDSASEANTESGSADEGRSGNEPDGIYGFFRLDTKAETLTEIAVRRGWEQPSGSIAILPGAGIIADGQLEDYWGYPLGRVVFVGHPKLCPLFDSMTTEAIEASTHGGVDKVRAAVRTFDNLSRSGGAGKTPRQKWIIKQYARSAIADLEREIGKLDDYRR